MLCQRSRPTQPIPGILVDDVTSVMSVPVSVIDQTPHTRNDKLYILGIIKKASYNWDDTWKELIIWIDII